MKAKLIAVTKPVVEGIEEAKDLIAYCARVSNPSNQMNMDTAEKLVNYLIKHKHFSPLEMANCVVEVEAPRDIARQLLRHRSFSFQEFCIAGDSKITMLLDNGSSYKISIEDLYNRQNSKYKSRANWNVRHYNEETGSFEAAKIKEVFDTGIKECFELTLESSHSKVGRSIKCTADHKVFTLGGWKRVGDLTTDDFVAENGVPLYQDKAWLLGAKQASIESGTGLKGIADIAGVSTHTIRKWLKIHKLQFTHKKVASYTEVWNKGLAAEHQPMYGKFHSKTTRDKMQQSSRSGTASEFYKHGGFTQENSPFRKIVSQWARGYAGELLVKQNFRCAATGVEITLENAEVDHLLPIYARPDLAYDLENIRLISKEAHLDKTRKEAKDSRLTAKYKKVASIVPVGKLQTYDMEIDAPSHNYIANGIVTHNSQRYADVNSLQDSFIIRDCRMQDAKNRQNSVPASDEATVTWWKQVQEGLLQDVQAIYKEALDRGIAKEVARIVLPEGMTNSRLYVNGTIRSWCHYLEVRTEEGVTQLEHVELARLISSAIVEAFPQVQQFTH
jgi:thymidylate synthase (FAD)